jgi:hypothetical protein
MEMMDFSTEVTVAWFVCHTINPHLIICDYLQKEFGVSFFRPLKVLAHVTSFSFSSSLSRYGTNLVAARHMFRLSFKIML